MAWRATWCSCREWRDEVRCAGCMRTRPALCLTSTLEGNFPPQVREALEYGTPVVATRIAPIVEALGDVAADLLLCAPLDLADFCTNLTQALKHPADILARQERVVSALRAVATRSKNSTRSLHRSSIR